MSGPEMKRLVDAIVSAFSDDELQMLVELELGIALDTVVERGPLLKRSFETVRYTERVGRTPELVAAMLRGRPEREDIQRAYRGYTTQVAAQAAAAGPVPNAAARDYAKVFGGQPAVALQSGHGAESVVTPADPGFQKTVRDDLGFLPAATWSALSGRMQPRVCRVELNDANNGMGSGFLVGPDTLLTAYHVIKPIHDNPGMAAAVRFRFDFQWQGDGTTSDGVVVGLAAAGDPAVPWLLSHARYSDGEAAGSPDIPPPVNGQLDYALVRLDRRVGDEPIAGGSPRGWIEVPANQPAVNGMQFLMILQHPARRPLELAFDTHANARLEFGGLRLRYATNTEGGSSGSPVFDKYWKLVGLHHYGDPAYNHPPTYNQAVPIGLIRAHLAQTPTALASLGRDTDTLRHIKALSAAALAVRAALAGGAATADRIAAAAQQASISAQAGSPMSSLADAAREVIDREIGRIEQAWNDGMKSPDAVVKKQVTDRFTADFCTVLKLAGERNGGLLPPDWQMLWSRHGCT